MGACWVLYCRAGFEHECAAEVQAEAAARGVFGFAQAQPGGAHVVFTPQPPLLDRPESDLLAFRELVFARQLFRSTGLLDALPVTDRVTPLAEALCAQAPRLSEVLVETADTNAAKELLGLARKLSVPLRQHLRRLGCLRPGDAGGRRGHVFLLSGTAAYPGTSDPANASPWLMGIPRLKCPREAPSRSTLKLEEALLVFLSAEEREARLRPGLRAVDLGAAPGGWTWQLVRRGLRVTAVDNGPLAPQVLASGLVEHLRVDGFRYQPRRPVAWLVCDMVEQPRRIAQLVASWLARGWCRECIFNLKLPMKRRYDELRGCATLIGAELARAGVPFRLAFKQLYHDREEVTGHLLRLGD